VTTYTIALSCSFENAVISQKVIENITKNKKITMSKKTTMSKNIMRKTEEQQLRHKNNLVLIPRKREKKGGRRRKRTIFAEGR
jgi:hypothetical protein